MSAIDFSRLMVDASRGYLERPRLENTVSEALDAGVVVVAGPPGSGKTALAATLIRRENYLHHFLRAGHTEFTLWKDPYGFLTSLGFQLQQRYGEALFPAFVAVDVSGRVHNVAEGGRVAGVSIKRLLTVPWRRARVHAQLDIDELQGQAEGVRIEELVDEYRSLPLVTYREMALLGPLAKLHELKPDEYLVLWIDALDEEMGTPEGRDTIAGVLPTAEELQVLGNLSIIISTRQGRHLKRFIDSGAEVIELNEPAFAAENEALIDAFIAREMADSSVTQTIEAAGRSVEDLTAAIKANAQANPLYVYQYFQAVRDQNEALIVDVPEGLAAIYARLMDGLVARTGSLFSQVVQPLLTILAAARQPLNSGELSAFTGLSREDANVAVEWLRPFLTSHAAQDGARHALYQRAFQEALTDEATRDEPWHIDGAAANDAIANHYLQNQGEAWQGLDDYGYDFLTTHLARGSAASREQFLSLLGPSWRRSQRRHQGSNLPFLRDLERAWAISQSLPWPRSMIQTARLGLMWTVMDAADLELPAGALRVMVRTGQVQRALDTVRPELSGGAQAGRLAEIAAGLAAGGEAHGALGRHVLQQGLEALSQDPDGLALAQLLAAYPMTQDVILDPLLEQALALWQELPANWQRGRPMIEIARLKAGLNPQQTGEWFSNALEHAEHWLASSLPYELDRLFTYWADVDAQQAVEQLQYVQFQPVLHSVRAILAVGKALQQSDTPGALDSFLQQLDQNFLSQMENPYDRSRSLVAMGRAHLLLDDGTAAQTRLAEAVQAEAEIGGDSDPDRTLQNRPAQGTDALIDIAALAVEAGLEDGAVHLDKAWKSLTENGTWSDGALLASLVEAQLASYPALLEAYVGRMARSDRRSEVLVAWAEALAEDRDSGARTTLEEALIDAEKPHVGGRRTDFYFQLARAGAALDRAETERLAGRRLAITEVVAYRMEALSPAGQENEALHWLRETVQMWASGVDNVHYLSHLPAALVSLPRPLLQALADDVPEMDGPHRCLFLAGLGAALERQTPGQGRRLLEQALQALESAATAQIPSYVLLAFVAGQWWDLDRTGAEQWWQEALLALAGNPAFADDADRRHTWLMIVVEQLQRGNAAAALPTLLTCEQPRSDGFWMVVPGPQVAAYEAAGMSQRDHLLAKTLGQVVAGEEGKSRAYVETMLPVAARSLALSLIARDSGEAMILPERLRCVDLALAAAEDVETPYLQALLTADAARTLWAAGIRQKAMEVARAAVALVKEAPRRSGSMPVAGYAHAMGHCLSLFLARENSGEALQHLWESRHLGNDGFYQILGHLCAPAAAGGFEPLAALAEAEQEAMGLFG